MYTSIVPMFAHTERTHTYIYTHARALCFRISILYSRMTKFSRRALSGEGETGMQLRNWYFRL